MTRTIKLSDITELRVLGTRFLAKNVRSLIERASTEAESIVIDFQGVTVTQSYIDELLGPLLLKHGDSLLDRVAFRSCSDDVRAVISFVIAERLGDFADRRARPPKSATALC